MILVNTYVLLILLIVAVTAFSAGLVFPLIGQAVIGRQGGNVLARCIGSLWLFIKKNARLFIGFTLGVVITWFIVIYANPYYVARLTGMYNEMVVGSLVLDEGAMETGQISPKLMEWYKKHAHEDNYQCHIKTLMDGWE